MHTLPTMHRTLAIIIFISLAVESPNSGFFFGEEVVGIALVGNILTGVTVN